MPFTSVTAVVDRLPTPTGGSTEGLAYAWASQGIHDRIAETPNAKHALDQNKPGNLHFSWPARSSKRYTLQLPLAQTVFSTGQVSTMTRTQYELSSSGTLQPGRSQQLMSAGFDLPFQSQTSHARRHFPLVPLTPARTVENCMGNVVRSLKDPSESSATDKEVESQPASSELEAAVSAYFKACDIDPEPVNVWALVASFEHIQTKTAKPSDLTLMRLSATDIRASWGPKARQSTYQSGVASFDVDAGMSGALKYGARLCRVLSGGGGWGKKAGLLSLDPDDSYSTESIRSEKDWSPPLEDPDQESDVRDIMKREERATLGETVRKGESIMFFIAPLNLSAKVASMNNGTRSIGDQKTPYGPSELPSAVFGPIPSTIDSIPGQISSSTSTEANSDSLVEHHADFFGMLSEGGMALTTEQPAEEKSEAKFYQTKLDVPHARLVVTTLQAGE